MTDTKLDKLIDEYAFQVLDKGGLCTNDIDIDIFAARKAIIDYVDADYNEALREGHNDGYQDALKPIREVYEAYKHNDGVYFNNVCSPLWQAIKSALEIK